jgi:hypothetical protein
MYDPLCVIPCLTILFYPLIAADGGPYCTVASGSPGAMKFVSGFLAAFAAEARAMVGELEILSAWWLVNWRG